MTKTVSINIDPDDLTTLRPEDGTPYNLCFARKVGDLFNIVWQSGTDYGPYNDFSWDPVFELFATNYFENAVKVRVQSNSIPIALGQQSTLDNRKVLSRPGDQVDNPDPLSIRMINNYKPIHAGLKAVSILNGIKTTTPVFVSPDLDVLGAVNLTPKEVVRVWFERNIETSTMYEQSISRGIEVDLTHDDTATQVYKGGKWHTPAQPRLTSYEADVDGPLILQIVFTVASVVVISNVLGLIRNYLGITTIFEVTGSSGAHSVTINYSEKKGAGLYAMRQLEDLRGTYYLNSNLVDYAIKALSTLKIQWSDMDVRPGP